MRVEVGFHHAGGGDSLLPRPNRGFFDSYTVDVHANTPHEAEIRGIEAMYAMRAAEHPGWVNRSVDDLCAEIWIDGKRLAYDDELWHKPFAKV